MMISKGMAHARPQGGWLIAAALAGFMAVAGAAQAQTAFSETGSFAGRLGASGPDRGPIVPGGEATITGSGLTPGQLVVLRQSGVALNDGAPLTADDKGNFTATVTIPDNAQTGSYPVVAEIQNPPYATTFDVKVSPNLGEMGADKYDVVSQKLAPGLYQVAESNKLGAVFVASAVGRPPVEASQLIKLDAKTLEQLAAVTPAADAQGGGVFAVYGVGVEEDLGQVWVTNTRQNTVAVYSADDLSLIKQFDADLVPHPRDVVLLNGKAYVSATFVPEVHVFDAKTLEPAGVIELKSGERRGEFGTGGIAVDAADNTLYVSSLSSSEVAVVDLATDEQTAVFAVPGSDNTIGVAYDATRKQIYTAGQGSDNVTILNGETGAVIKSVAVGANPLNLAVDPETGNVYVTVRASDSVVVMSPEGDLLANLNVGSFPNHLTLDGEGGVLVVNKAKGKDDPKGDMITRITPKM
jgi:YVTN family beta-propeller protein